MHHVFVDLENVPKVDLTAVDGGDVQVTLLIGKNQKKLDVALVRQIQRLGPQVELVEVGASGKNALDLTLAYYLGRAAARPPDAQYYIVSKDKDYTPMIAHLHAKGVTVTRCDSFAALPFMARAAKRATVPPFTPPPKPAAPGRRATMAPIPPAPPRAAPPVRRTTVPPMSQAARKTASPFKKAPDDRRTKVIARLKNPASKNRPATRKRLLAYIKAALNEEGTDAAAEEIIRELLAGRALVIETSGRVRYAT